MLHIKEMDAVILSIFSPMDYYFLVHPSSSFLHNELSPGESNKFPFCEFSPEKNVNGECSKFRVKLGEK